MKNLILILAIAFVAMFSSIRAEEEILWKSHYRGLIDPNGAVDPGYIYNAIFTPDDKYIIVSCERRTFLVESETGKYVRDLKDVAGVIRFSNDGKYIYTYDNRKINFETGEVVGTFTEKGQKLGRFDKMDVSEYSGVMVALKRNDPPRNEWVPNLWIFDLKTMELIEKVGTKDNYYYNFELAQKGDFFRAESEYTILNTPYNPKYQSFIWDVNIRKERQNNNFLGNFKTSPDGRWIGSVSLNKVALFEVQSYKKVWETTQGGGGTLTGVAFSPDSKYFSTCAYGSDDDLNDIHVWNVETSKNNYRYNNHNIWNQDYLSYSNNSKLILGWNDRGIIVYNAIYTSTRVDPIINSDTNIVSPNPATNTISINDVETNYRIKLYSETGQDINVLSISNYYDNKLVVDVQGLTNGTYYLVLTQNNISKLFKFIKE